MLLLKRLNIFLKKKNRRPALIFFFVSMAILSFRGKQEGLPAKERYAGESQKMTKEANGYLISFSSRSFAQGDALYLHIQPVKNKNEPEFNKKLNSVNLSSGRGGVRLFGRRYPIQCNKDYCDSLLSISVKQKPGRYRAGIDLLEIPIKQTRFDSGSVKNGKIKKKNYSWSFSLPVQKTDFPVSYITLRVAKKFTQSLSKRKKREIAAQKAKIRKAFRINSKRKWSPPFWDPREWAAITSEFYKTRYYNGVRGWPHGGVDISGARGEPVRAIQDGRVVLSDSFYYEGNMVILDHGNKIFSYYQHLQKRYVKEGSLVKKGELIGLVGASGIATGPHLHLSVRIQGELLAPLSLLALPLEDLMER